MSSAYHPETDGSTEHQPYAPLIPVGNSTFRMDIPSRLEQRGLHDAFRASLLRIHIPNDDRLFPG
ncbi:hypothetical protein BT96DRAFT_829148 [Gymnopus androsaceus JB14]|uniref:Uncharacterized protein n=1 Tax=Gymnopus androsaceus JB14 TaxID=1447944 RepID=A0A6A4H5P8_9AGAR|nr:hypothetical protein BT96DRAFT_829148 [Gymnopus androsaceus JB14]